MMNFFLSYIFLLGGGAIVLHVTAGPLEEYLNNGRENKVLSWILRSILAMGLTFTGLNLLELDLSLWFPAALAVLAWSQIISFALEGSSAPRNKVKEQEERIQSPKESSQLGKQKEKIEFSFTCPELKSSLWEPAEKKDYDRFGEKGPE